MYPPHPDLGLELHRIRQTELESAVQQHRLCRSSRQPVGRTGAGKALGAARLLLAKGLRQAADQLAPGLPIAEREAIANQ